MTLFWNFPRMFTAQAQLKNIIQKDLDNLQNMLQINFDKLQNILQIDFDNL